MVDPSEIEKRLTGAISEAQVGIQDLTGNGDHYRILVVSPDFNGKSLLERHQMVNNALADLLKNQLHAIQIKTFTPQQWEKEA